MTAPPSPPKPMGPVMADQNNAPELPDRIWLDERTFNGAVGFAHSKQHHPGAWAEYTRADRPAPEGQVEVEGRWLELAEAFREWDACDDEHEYGRVIEKVRAAYRAALTPPPAAPTDNTALVEALQFYANWPEQNDVDAYGISDDRGAVARAALASREAPPAAQEPVAQRCAECDCENGGKECTWIKWTKPEPACQQEAVTESDLAAARAEIERLTKERDNLSKLEQSHREQANEQFHRANKAEVERDEARVMLADAERDMRQRAAEFVGQEASTFPDNVAWGVEDLAKAILALPLKHADREGGV